MKFKFILVTFFLVMQFASFSQIKKTFKIPAVPNPEIRMENLKQQWKDLHQTPPRLGVRDCFLFLLDALDTKFLTQEELLWTINLVKTRVITDSTKPSFGNMYWGWNETGGDVGDGNNVEFCVQYGILIKLLFNDRLADDTRASLDELFAMTLKGVRRQPVRISYTNIYLMRCWNFIALGQAYNNASVIEEGRKAFDIWLKHVANYGNREYDSPTYSGVDIESLLLMYQFAKDADIHQKAADALEFFLTDLAAHYNSLGGFLAGAHSRDYNRVFGRDLLEEKYFNPLLGRENKNNQLFNQICFSILKERGLSKFQQEIMDKPKRFIEQRWDSFPHTFTTDYHGKKFSIASSSQYYSPDDKSFIMYLNSKRIPEMPNIVYAMEGRNDHYGTWGATGMGEKMKHLMPPNYPSNGGWGKTRHLMPFMQASQNKNEFVMLVSGDKDHNCINDYVNSTVLLPNYFDQLYFGNTRIMQRAVGTEIPLDSTNTFFAKFEDVAIAIKILYSNADNGERATLFNDGFKYNSSREAFNLVHNEALRLTLKHPNNGKGNIVMWWKAEEGIDTEAKFKSFRNSVLDAPVTVTDSNNVLDVFVQTTSGKLGLKADLKKKVRLDYYNPTPLNRNILFNIDGVDVGKKIMQKYK
jgi:hypothetical protein